MAPSKLVLLVVATILVLLPIAAKGDGIPPALAPFYDNLCREVECGRGRCEGAPGEAFGFKCECDDGWRRTRFDDEDHLEFLPCVIPNCTLDYGCMPAAPPTPPPPQNSSVFDPCYWIYCGEGTCTRNSTYAHTCQCDPGFTNLLNITAFPCYSDCAIGSDCERLGIRVSNSSTSSPSGGGGNGGNQATSFLPGKFHLVAILLISMIMVMRK